MRGSNNLGLNPLSGIGATGDVSDTDSSPNIWDKFSTFDRELFIDIKHINVSALRESICKHSLVEAIVPSTWIIFSLFVPYRDAPIFSKIIT